MGGKRATKRMLQTLINGRRNGAEGGKAIIKRTDTHTPVSHRFLPTRLACMRSRSRYRVSPLIRIKRRNLDWLGNKIHRWQVKDRWRLERTNIAHRMSKNKVTTTGDKQNIFLLSQSLIRGTKQDAWRQRVMQSKGAATGWWEHGARTFT